MNKLIELHEKRLSRRKFLAGASALSAASVVAGCNTNNGNTTAPPPTSGAFTDADVLNFALNLEYLEAEFYLYAATGSGLNAADRSLPTGGTSTFTQGTVNASGAAQVGSLTSGQQSILNEIAYDEQQHVRFLRSALATAAVPEPSIDLTFFAPLAVAAGITTSATFSPFVNFDTFLVGAFIFEDVGVSAYSGAAPLITSGGIASGFLSAAAGILAVEAYHAAYVRTTLTGRAILAASAQPATAYPYLGYANQVSALRQALSVGAGTVETALTLPTTPATPSAIVAADRTNAIAFARSVNQVHHIVYGSPTVGVAKGGFFPNGTNSIFATTTA